MAEITFTQAELEMMGVVQAPTGLEAEAVEAEDVDFDAMSDDAILDTAFQMAEEAAGPEAMVEAGPARRVNRRLARIVLRALRSVIRRVLRNLELRRKLQEACRRGPDAVAGLLLSPVLALVPFYLRWIVRPVFRNLIRASFRAICRQAGATRAEVEAHELELY